MIGRVADLSDCDFFGACGGLKENPYFSERAFGALGPCRWAVRSQYFFTISCVSNFHLRGDLTKLFAQDGAAGAKNLHF